VSPGVAVSVERGWADDLATPRAVLAGPGAALVLIATFTATGLALADARPDFATLAAVGAAPRTRRRMAMGSAAVVGGSGAVLGLLVGLAPGIAVSLPLTTDGYVNGVAEHVLDIPWALLGRRRAGRTPAGDGDGGHRARRPLPAADGAPARLTAGQAPAQPPGTGSV
jgi:hypothetical protein